MSRSWQFSDVEFAVLWEDLKEEFLPRPLNFASRTEWYDELLELKAVTRENLRAKRDRTFDGVLPAIHQPDIRIAVHGWDGRDRLNAEATIKLLATRRAERGYLVTQLPGETYLHSSGFTVRECAALQLADVVVDALPECSEGKHADTALVTADVRADIDYSFGRSKTSDSFDDSAAARSAAFLRSAATRMGTIDIVQGRSIFGPRGITRHRIEWRDLVDDGRYAIPDEHPPIAHAVDRARLVTMINTRIAAVVRAIKDESA